MICSTCGGEMTDGWVAMWNPFFGKVRWQPTQPGYVRMRVPQGAKVVLEPRAGGKDARRALRCSACGTTLIPPDPTYDETQAVRVSGY